MKTYEFDLEVSFSKHTSGIVHHNINFKKDAQEEQIKGDARR
jgi:hypothetical protein